MPTDALPCTTTVRGQVAVYDCLPDEGYVCYLYRPGEDRDATPAGVFGPCRTRGLLHEELIRRLVYGGPARRRDYPMLPVDE